MELCAGIDEVGRGCLAGPVVVAAVILPNVDDTDNDDEFVTTWNQINDSKKLSEKKRNLLDSFIRSIAIDYSIVFIDHTEIDRLNIRNATLRGMQRAYKELNIEPEHLYIDGNFYLPIDEESFTCIPQGDGKYTCISAASILAKVARDTYVKEIMHPQYPEYNWNKNKAYGTKEHYDAIHEYGICDLHRRSFNLHQ